MLCVVCREHRHSCALSNTHTVAFLLYFFPHLPSPPLAYVCSLSTISQSYPSDFSQIPSFRCKAFTISPFYSNHFPPLSLFYSACVTPIAAPLCGLPSVRSLLLIVSCVWPGHFKLNIYRPIYLPPVARWFKYWHRVFVFSHARSGQGCRRLGEGGAQLGQDKTGLEKGKESKV